MNHDISMGNLNFERKELDFYPTPVEVTHVLPPFLFQEPFNLSAENSVWECACGYGQMSKVLKQYFEQVISTDINNYGYGYSPVDFYTQKEPFSSVIITNPPYGKDAERFVRRGLELTKDYNGIVCMLLRKEFDSALSRNDIFNKNSPFCMKIDLLWRPVWFPDYYGTDPSPRHNFSWFVWMWEWCGKRAMLEYVHKPKTIHSQLRKVMK